jgi:protein SCO1/2
MIRKTLVFVALIIFTSSTASKGIASLDEMPPLSGEQRGGDFTLESSRGKFSLQHLRGKVVLLYFGYTKCPDVCPTSLSLLAQALNELSTDELKSVRGVFVTIDPGRDSLEVLDDYVSYFHPNLIGVTGSDSEVAEVAELYGIQYHQVDLKDSAFGYGVNHSSATYLVTQEGELRFVFPHQTPSIVILQAIRYVLGTE